MNLEECVRINESAGEGGGVKILAVHENDRSDASPDRRHRKKEGKDVGGLWQY